MLRTKLLADNFTIVRRGDFRYAYLIKQDNEKSTILSHGHDTIQIFDIPDKGIFFAAVAPSSPYKKYILNTSGGIIGQKYDILDINKNQGVIIGSLLPKDFNTIKLGETYRVEKIKYDPFSGDIIKTWRAKQVKKED